MRFVELFAGAGGMSLGLQAAGHEHLLGVEWDKDAHTTYVGGGFEGVRGDVRDVGVVDRIVAACGGEPLDLLAGGPPCQAFSNAGKRGAAHDDRNGWPWFLSVLLKLKGQGLGPTWFVCENVKGMLSHRKKAHGGKYTGVVADDVMACPRCYWDEVLLPAFRDVFEWVDWWVLNAADYGVPQRRHRVFLVGGPRRIEPPIQTHSQQALVHDKWVSRSYWERLGINAVGAPSKEERRVLKKMNGVTPQHAPWNTIRQALGLEQVVGGGRNPQSPELAEKRNFRDLTDEPSVTMAAQQVGNRGPWFSAIRHQSPSAGTIQHPVDALCPTVGGKGVLYAEAEKQEGTHNPHYHAHRLEMLDKPSVAVCATEVKGARHQKWTPDKSPMRASDQIFRATGRRRLTVEECALLQDFPQDWEFNGTKASRYMQVGNAVPSRLARAVGLAIAKGDVDGK
jgi:DNA-cytosine methyltransferase